MFQTLYDIEIDITQRHIAQNETGSRKLRERGKKIFPDEKESADLRNETGLAESRSPACVYTDFITYINCTYLCFVA